MGIKANNELWINDCQVSCSGTTSGGGTSAVDWEILMEI